MKPEVRENMQNQEQKEGDVVSPYLIRMLNPLGTQGVRPLQIGLIWRAEGCYSGNGGTMVSYCRSK
jgi:hypothetical protein